MPGCIGDANVWHYVEQYEHRGGVDVNCERG